MKNLWLREIWLKRSKSEQAIGIITRCIACTVEKKKSGIARHRARGRAANATSCAWCSLLHARRALYLDNFWHILVRFDGYKKEDFVIFRGSVIGYWKVRFTTSEVSFGAHSKPLEARSSKNSYAILFLSIGIIILSVWVAKQF